MSSLPSGTVTFLFADVEGSTTLLQRVGDAAYARLLAEGRRLLLTACATGNLVNTEGDALFAAFRRVSDAMTAAVAAQRLLAEYPWPDGIPLRFRIGLHTGEAAEIAGGYAGLDVNRAARICSAGHGGQILLSDAVQALVKDRLPDGVALLDLGRHRLKDLADAPHIYQVVVDGLPSQFPPLRSLQILATNLPREVTSFIGRGREIAALKDLLSDAPLVTLTGSGGVGKTRLAIRVAADLLHYYADGVWLAELAALSDPRLVPKVVATALSVPEHPGRPLVDALVDALRAKTLLLILDNCEHLVTSCAELSHTLLSACAGLRIIATSREPLRTRGEAIFRVPSLSVPDPVDLPTLDRLIEYESIRLFIDRASLAHVGFELTHRNGAAAAQIARGLDGIPLAIELAAARMKSLPISVIAERLDDRLRLLTGGRQTGLPRQQTLRTALDWSHDLLTDRERVLFRRLSVFAGSFTLEATEQICKEDGIEERDVLDLLAHLVDKSLVAFAPDPDGRYRLLETISQYGHEKLEECGEADRVQRRHRDWYLALAEKAEPEMRASAQADWLERLEGEHDNFRRALAWCISSGEEESGLRLASALWWFWDVRGYHREGREWLENSLRRSTSTSLFRVRGLHGVGFFAVRRKDVAVAQAAFEEALALSRAIGDRPGIALSLFGLGRAAMLEPPYEPAISFFDEARRLFESVGDKSRMSWVSNCSGLIAARQGDFANARAHYLEGLELGLAAGDRWIIGYLTGNLGVLAFHERSYEAAKSYYRDALAIHLELKARLPMIASLEDIGLVSAALGHAERAARLLGAAEAQGELLGIHPPIDPTNQSLPDYLVRLRATLGEGVAAERLAEGRAMSLEQAVGYALAETST